MEQTQMNWADIILWIMIIISILISIWRGFIREFFSLLVWAAAIWVAFVFYQPFAEWMIPYTEWMGRYAEWTSRYIELPSIRNGLSFGLLFISTLGLGGTLNYYLNKMIKKVGISGMDRFFGIFFGLARGLLIAVLLVLMLQFTPASQTPWWSESIMITHIEPWANQLKDWLKTHWQSMPDPLTMSKEPESDEISKEPEPAEAAKLKSDSNEQKPTSPAEDTHQSSPAQTETAPSKPEVVPVQTLNELTIEEKEEEPSPPAVFRPERPNRPFLY